MKKKASAKGLEKRMPAVHKAIQKVLKNKGLGDLRVTHMSLMSGSGEPPESGCDGHWEWRCEMTPQGYVCHYVCVSNQMS